MTSHSILPIIIKPYCIQSHVISSVSCMELRYPQPVPLMQILVEITEEDLTEEVSRARGKERGEGPWAMGQSEG